MVKEKKMYFESGIIDNLKERQGNWNYHTADLMPLTYQVDGIFKIWF